MQQTQRRRETQRAARSTRTASSATRTRSSALSLLLSSLLLLSLLWLLLLLLFCQSKRTGNSLGASTQRILVYGHVDLCSNFTSLQLTPTSFGSNFPRRYLYILQFHPFKRRSWSNLNHKRAECWYVKRPYALSALQWCSQLPFQVCSYRLP